MLEEDSDETCWNNLENFRVKLISVIDPSRITPYLRQCKVISHDDEEQVLNDPSLVMRKRKADTAGESGLSQLLMNEIMKLQSTVQEERRKAQELTMWLHTKEDTIREMWVRDSLLRKHQERAQKMKEERDSLSKELRKCKDENYNLAMSYAKQSEEKSTALMKNRDLILEIDHLKHSLMKAEDDCKLERKHTMKLKHAIEQRPSHEVMWEIQQEKELLLAKNQELENTLQQVAREQNLEKSLSNETLENDCSQILEERRELMNTIYSLRKELRQAEVLQDKYAEEKEMLELQCTSLRKDSQMYKKRIEAVLQQMEEVASERDQALLTREQFYMQYSKNLVERDAYRKQIRELGERCDEMQLQLFQKESQLLATEAKMKRLQLELPTPTSDLDDTSSRDSQELTLHGHLDEDTQPTKNCPEGQNEQFSTRESSLPPKSPSFKECGLANEELAEKERRRMKDCFERYRRKRAMRRVPKNRQHEADWENTTGSDDTEGS
ncbi:caspase recruitment domain-containing protein 9 isoform X4 [Pelecanus crispus]|uniref:caspase recruitment domain-containing protein 9 isoform X4 n=1 Tax=Pelecanus crispus TaxID=36300 RepID=UPI003F5D2361